MFERYTSKLLLTPRITVGALIFDVYPKVQHSSDSRITMFPIQTGGYVNDHKIDLPDTLIYQIGMSDCCQDIIPGQFAKSNGNFIDIIKPSNISKNAKDLINNVKTNKSLNFIYANSRSINAFRILSLMKKAGVVFSCTTRLKTYDNMVIKHIEAPEDYTTLHGLKATVYMQELNLVSPEEVKVSSSKHVTDTTSKGMQTAQPLESIIYQKGGLGPALFTPL